MWLQFIVDMGLYRNKSEKWIELDRRTSAESDSFVCLICRKLKVGQRRKLHFQVGFNLEMAFKTFNGSHKVVFYDINSIT